MLNVLIVESDPVIAMDLSDSVLSRDATAQVTVRSETLAEAEAALVGGRHSHAFLRMPRRAALDVAVRVAHRLGRAGTNVILHGAETMPEALSAAPRVSIMPFPFTARDVACCIARDSCGSTAPAA
ncbi:hypothetical protein [Citreimonas salinaria]|uniref:Response regulatory domain-containing protein n=1 Tax=Citreimonas salinaria TaxID=321339 RepID=A0A1H3H6V6_9RHOB|nr:hypothetical protein [Citreimonas salinaria]SDY10379.1 hypothetical protein SAMN05444340_103226 [Citreimonas salinaria]